MNAVDSTVPLFEDRACKEILATLRRPSSKHHHGHYYYYYILGPHLRGKKYGDKSFNVCVLDLRNE